MQESKIPNKFTIIVLQDSAVYKQIKIYVTVIKCK